MVCLSWDRDSFSRYIGRGELVHDERALSKDLARFITIFSPRVVLDRRVVALSNC